jgi:hypothetical protein
MPPSCASAVTLFRSCPIVESVEADLLITERTGPADVQTARRMAVKNREQLFQKPRPGTPPGREKATRQQGGFFSRENSSNGGKAIRTFLAS